MAYRDRYPAGNLDLGNVPVIWDGIDATWARALEFVDPPSNFLLTARKIDLSQPAGNRVYTEAWRHLQCAMDNLQALQGLLSSSSGATPWAPWNLIRPTFESAFYALWVLEPDLSEARRRRALRLELIGQRERNNFWEELGHIAGTQGREVRDAASERRTEVNKVYRQEAERLGVAWAHAGDTINVRDEVGKLRTVTDEPGTDTAVYFRSTWRSLSGYQHGHGYALLGLC